MVQGILQERVLDLVLLLKEVVLPHEGSFILGDVEETLPLGTQHKFGPFSQRNGSIFIDAEEEREALLQSVQLLARLPAESDHSQPSDIAGFNGARGWKHGPFSQEATLNVDSRSHPRCASRGA